MWRWLAADPRDVVDLAGAGALAGGSEGPDLGEELRRWRQIVARRRLVALVRRHGAVALGLAAVLEILAQLGAVPQSVVVAVPLAVLLVSVATFALRGPSPFGLARLLDDKLGLNDRLATALEIEARGGGETPLERRTVTDAAALLRAGREDWHASPARAGRDWWALGGPVLALAVVIAIGAATSGSSSASDRLAAGPGGELAAGATPGERQSERERKQDQNRIKRQLGLEGKRSHKRAGANNSATPNQASAQAGYQPIPQGGKTARERGGAAAKGKAPSGGKKANGAPGRSGGPGGHGKSEASNPKGVTNTSTPGGTGGAKSGGKSGTKKSETAKGKSQLPGGGAGAAGTKPGSKPGQSGAGGEQASQSEKQGGTPGGTSKAGGERGSTQPGHAKPIAGKASQTVRIKPGYAPARSAEKGGKQPDKPGDSQGGGGKSRTAQVTGGTQVGDQFSYVPAAGGAVPGPSAGLQLNYLESLKWVERLQW